MAKFYTLYGEKPVCPGIVFTEPSMTDGSFKYETDIHHIVKDFGQTGILADANAHDPELLVYGDTTLAPDYLTALKMTTQVEQEFGQLPSDIRKEFGNSPVQLLEALGSDKPDVISKLERLGLKEKAVPKAEAPTPAATQTAEASS